MDQSAAATPLLFYSPGACSLAGQIVLEWLGRPYALCRVEPAVRGTELYRRVNPRGQVPALRTSDGRMLVENSAVLQYLANLRPELQLAPDARSVEGDTLNQLLSYLGSGFHVAFYPLFLPERYTTDYANIESVLEAAAARVRSELAYVEGRLSDGRTWLMGDRRSILDPYLFAMARWATKVAELDAECPRLAAFQRRMERDPAVQFALAIERGEQGPGHRSYVRSCELTAM